MAGEVSGAFFDEFVQGGLLDDADVTIKSARFSAWDYNGKIKDPVLALKVDMEDGEGTVHEQYLSAGDLKFFSPSEDGKRAVPQGTGNKLNINTNAVGLIMSIINADTRGEMAAKIRATNDISVLDGLKCHIIRKAQPKRAGILQQQGDDTREKTAIQVEKIIAYPWEAAPATTAGAKTAAPAAATATATAGAPASAAADAAVTLLLQIVSENNGSLKKSAIAGKAFANPDFKALPAPERNAILGIIVKPEFLASETVKSMGMSFASDTVTLG